ncbi:hypothetical protein ACFSUS_17265 [Spirosoma soli]|uniref:Outer membrane beta-barrel protein n=1 Tax=Spirosoma soli TaxID=1770529 RepID=A0ABW5M603_9BACT
MRTFIRSVGWMGVFLGVSFLAKAQLQADSAAVRKRDPYTLVITTGGGLSYYATQLGVPASLEQARAIRFGLPGSLRVMWHPDHRLRVGLETGWTTLYSYRGRVAGERAQVYVSAVPILLEFSMPLAWVSGTERSLARRLSLTAGAGVYLINSRLNFAGRVDDGTASTGWMAAGTYTYPVGRRFRIAGEVKWFDAVASGDAVFIAQLQLVWRAFSW